MKEWCYKIFCKFDLLVELTNSYKNRWESFNSGGRAEETKYLQNLKRHINNSFRDFYLQLENIPISAINPEGLRVDIDFQQEKKYWQDFYQKLKVNDINNKKIEIPDSLKLTFKSKMRMKECIEKYGFDYLMIIPPGISPDSLLDNVRFSEYFDQNSGLYLRVEKVYDNGILQEGIMKRVNKKWRIVFGKLKAKYDRKKNGDKIETEGKSFNDIQKIAAANNLKGMDALDFIIYSRNHFMGKKDINGSPIMPFQENSPPSLWVWDEYLLQKPERIWLTGENIEKYADEGIVASWGMSYDVMNDFYLNAEEINLCMLMDQKNNIAKDTGGVLMAELGYEIKEND